MSSNLSTSTKTMLSFSTTYAALSVTGSSTFPGASGAARLGKVESVTYSRSLIEAHFEFVSFSDGGKKGHVSAVSRTTGRPAEVLREGSGTKVGGTAGDWLTISAFKDVRNLP